MPPTKVFKFKDERARSAVFLISRQVMSVEFYMFEIGGITLFIKIYFPKRIAVYWTVLINQLSPF